MFRRHVIAKGLQPREQKVLEEKAQRNLPEVLALQVLQALLEVQVQPQEQRRLLKLLLLHAREALVRIQTCALTPCLRRDGRLSFQTSQIPKRHHIFCITKMGTTSKQLRVISSANSKRWVAISRGLLPYLFWWLKFMLRMIAINCLYQISNKITKTIVNT
jgi:hypothetical protein